ncbi:MAG: hypothetical protein AAGK78_06720, partial [Planctomycetota bacterium]
VRPPWLLVPPLVVVAVGVALAGIPFASDPSYFTGMKDVIAKGYIIFATALVGSWWTGLLVGRPIGRLLMQFLIPPRPRQAMAFLWHADAKRAIVS